MLPKKRRVNVHLFPFVLEKGKTISSQHFSFKYARLSGPAESRFSFVVSGKVAKKATERNRLKRQERAIIQKKGHELKGVPVAGVFFAKKGATAITRQTIEGEMNDLLTKARLLNT